MDTWWLDDARRLEPHGPLGPPDASAARRECTQRAGDLIIVPDSLSHGLVNMGTTLALGWLLERRAVGGVGASTAEGEAVPRWRAADELARATRRVHIDRSVLVAQQASP